MCITIATYLAASIDDQIQFCRFQLWRAGDAGQVTHVFDFSKLEACPLVGNAVRSSLKIWLSRRVIDNDTRKVWVYESFTSVIDSAFSTQIVVKRENLHDSVKWVIKNWGSNPLSSDYCWKLNELVRCETRRANSEGRDITKCKSQVWWVKRNEVAARNCSLKNDLFSSAIYLLKFHSNVRWRWII